MPRSLTEAGSRVVWDAFEADSGHVAFLVYLFLTSLITAIFWKQIWAYLDRKKREQRQ